ncbi:MAG: diguanylate cyclase [Eubacteriales bacterium]
MAAILKRCSGMRDIVSRWGGDEFLILMPDATVEDAERFIERVTERCSAETTRNCSSASLAGIPCGQTKEDELAGNIARGGAADLPSQAND